MWESNVFAKVLKSVNEFKYAMSSNLYKHTGI